EDEQGQAGNREFANELAHRGDVSTAEMSANQRSINGLGSRVQAFGTMPPMGEPRIVPREEHPISRRDIDADALKVLYRLRQFNHIAYLVGGSVRDLILGRHPKDFDIGTSAHPYQVKKLFRNCWIIGRRFRLAHVKFGPNVIKVATFRRQLAPGEEVVRDGVPAPVAHPSPEPVDEVAIDDRSATAGDAARAERDHDMHRDNTFGT